MEDPEIAVADQLGVELEDFAGERRGIWRDGGPGRRRGRIGGESELRAHVRLALNEFLGARNETVRAGQVDLAGGVGQDAAYPGAYQGTPDL